MHLMSASLYSTLLILTLSSCASTKVHIYTEGLSDEELATTREIVSSLGHPSYLNNIPIPAQVNRPMLVYSPKHRSHRQLQELRRMLFDAGYTLDLVPASIGNNFYTKNNVGLYLKKYTDIERPLQLEAEPTPQNLLSGKTYSGRCPRADAYLDLLDNHIFVIDMLEYDSTSNKEISTLISGTWRATQTTLVLETEQEKTPFRIKKYRENFQTGSSLNKQTITYEGIRLNNSGNAFGQCNFIERNRAQL